MILAGGAGTRLWPLSRENLPKQFLKLNGAQSLLEATVARLHSVIAHDDILIVANERSAGEDAFLPLRGYRKLLEPVGRNTAPAIGLAALQAVQCGDDPVMVVLPADHAIADTAEFVKLLRQAIEVAAHGKLVAFGIEPRSPETGFGYLRTAGNQAAPRTVAEFKEKPDLATAQRMLDAGGWFWNSGMFVWRASVILGEIEAHLPDLHRVLRNIRVAVNAGMDWDGAIARHFPEAPSVSIDRGVLEKSRNLVLIPAAIGWSDIGTWDAIFEHAGKDDAGNSSSGDPIMVDCRNSFVRAESRLVAAVGLEDTIIVETADAVLVTRPGNSSALREAVARLGSDGSRREHIEHKTVQRPWGTYTVIDAGPGYKIKRIEVAAGGRLSLQTHRYRSEHWVVVRGTATVTRDGETFLLSPNESTYIPVGVRHRLENRGGEPLHIIETQVGSPVSESDIERFDDAYGRKVDDVG